MQDVYSMCRHGDFKTEIARALIGETVLTRYNNKTYRIDDIAWDMSPRKTFRDHTGAEISYMDYYKHQYNRTIEDPDQPLLLHIPKQKTNERRRSNRVSVAPLVLLFVESLKLFIDHSHRRSLVSGCCAIWFDICINVLWRILACCSCCLWYSCENESRQDVGKQLRSVHPEGSGVCLAFVSLTPSLDCSLPWSASSWCLSYVISQDWQTTCARTSALWRWVHPSVCL